MQADQRNEHHGAVAATTAAPIETDYTPFLVLIKKTYLLPLMLAIEGFITRTTCRTWTDHNPFSENTQTYIETITAGHIFPLQYQGQMPDSKHFIPLMSFHYSFLDRTDGHHLGNTNILTTPQ